MANSLEQQLAINKAIKERQKFLEIQSQEMQKQLNISKQIFALQKSLSGVNLDDAIEQIKNMSSALNEVREKSEDTSESLIGDMKKATKESHSFSSMWKNIKGAFGKFGDKIKQTKPTLFAFFEGFGDGLKFTFNMFKGIIGITATAVKGFLEIGMAIVSIPFKMLEGLFNIANKLTAMWVENAKAVEEVRKEFGTLATGTGAQIAKSFKNLTGVMSGFSMSMYSVFGTLAERIQFVNELFKGMGSIIHSFDKEISSNITTIGLFKKGLGFSAETMGDIAKRAKSMGDNLTTQLKRVSDMSFGLGEAFGINGKLIARSVGEMIKDVGHFGTLSVKTMSESATYVKALGMEVKSLAGIVDKFLNFEDAAMSAAKLSQVFGTNIDALKMMRLAGKEPAKALRTLQEAFFKTGRSAEQLGLAELRFLAKNVNLTEQEAKLAFSLKARGMSLDEIKKKSAETSKGQLTLEQSVAKVSSSVERLVKNLPQFKGFLDAFIQGFTKGLLHSKVFHQSLINLHQSAMEVARGALQIGKEFMDSFPGLNKFWKGFQKLFDPKEVKKLMGGIVEEFEHFFEMLSDPSKSQDALSSLFDGIKETFSEFFGINEEMKSGVSQFATTIRDLLVEAVPIVIQGGVDLLSAITQIIADPSKYIEDAKAGGSDVAKFLSPLFDAFKKASENSKLIEALKSFGKTLIDKTVSIVGAIIKEYPWESAMVILGPAIAGAIFNMLSVAFITLIPWKSIGGFLLRGIRTALNAFPLTKAITAFALVFFRIIKGWGDAKGWQGKLTLIFKSMLTSVVDVLTLGLWRFIPGLEEWLDEVFDKFEKWIPHIGTALKFFFSDIGDWISDKWDELWNYLPSAWKDFKSGFSALFDDIYSGIKSIIPTIWNFLKNNFPLLKIIDMMKQEDFGETMEKIGTSMLEGLKKGFEKVKDLLPGSIRSAIEVVKNVLDARSPSRVFMNLGENMSDGITLGIKDMPNQMNSVMKKAVSSSKNTLNSGMNSINNLTTKLQEDLKGIPAFDVQARMNQDMKIKDQKFEIQHKDLNMNINLNVIIEADQLAEKLAKTKKLVSSGRQI